MVSYPDNAHFLTDRERQIVLLTNEADRALKATETFSRSQIVVILSLPTVVTDLGYKNTTATLMACPPYGRRFVVVLAAGWTADKYRHWFWHYVVGVSVTMVALIVLMAVENLVMRYVMFFIIIFMCGAAAMGFIFSMGNIGGTVSGQIYCAAWAPRYVQGHAINLACYVIALLTRTAPWWSYKRDNALRDLKAAAGGDKAGPVKEGHMLQRPSTTSMMCKYHTHDTGYNASDVLTLQPPLKADSFT
ncbi:hypothetical protein DENSPDRAFT_913604 [Dentipellis sp. KUC8613]|nr:hypothetical protein DENSPDRAFT_913604 [Dentipellis sp. KUC8613]